MTRNRQILIGGLAAAVLLPALYLVLRPPEAPVGDVVYVLAEDVPAGAPITSSMLTVARMPSVLVPEDALLEEGEAVGLRAAVALFKGEVARRARLSADAQGLAHPCAGQGRRIFTLALRAEDAAGWWMSEGNRVDVHLLSARSGVLESHDLLPGIRVAGLLDAKGHPVAAGSEEAAPAILCLDVDASQAGMLAEAEVEGRIKVVLVNETME